MDDELIARLIRAVERLEELRDRSPKHDMFGRARLEGKIEGVKLAASYMEEGHRVFLPSEKTGED